MLEMVDGQLERSNPPTTEVLNRRAMHCVDAGARELSIPRFNATFPFR